MSVLTKQQKEWQAQDDARTLAQAEEITRNKPRSRAAVAEAKKMAIAAEKRATDFRNVAKISKKVNGSASPKRKSVKKTTAKRR